MPSCHELLLKTLTEFTANSSLLKLSVNFTSVSSVMDDDKDAIPILIDLPAFDAVDHSSCICSWSYIFTSYAMPLGLKLNVVLTGTSVGRGTGPRLLRRQRSGYLTGLI